MNEGKSRGSCPQYGDTADSGRAQAHQPHVGREFALQVRASSRLVLVRLQATRTAAAEIMKISMEVNVEQERNIAPSCPGRVSPWMHTLMISEHSFINTDKIIDHD